jgi:YVTN family beta-propeller protein/cysteine-rich repeat protein
MAFVLTGYGPLVVALVSIVCRMTDRLLLHVLMLALALAPRLAHAVTAQPLNPPTFTAEDLAQSLLAGEGIVISNVQFVGNNTAAGTFTDGAASIGIPDGIILSSGAVSGIQGPNEFDGLSTDFAGAGDPDLDTLTSSSTQDASVLEFDFVPSSSAITFTYVFASEEYNEYANTGFNDVFGFFVNGTNLALLPDGVTPVSINTVNGGNPDDQTGPVNPAFFVGNDCSDTPCSIDMEADGRTVALELHATVTPNVTNHMKIAIADTGDDSLDSWVFIQSGSFSVAENCTNGIDDDGDDLIDNADPDCHVCGDGNLDPGEQCDDGNVAPDDGCGPTCQLEGSTTTTSTTTSTVTTQPPTTTTTSTTSTLGTTSSTTTSTSSSTTSSTSTSVTTTTSTSSTSTTSTSSSTTSSTSTSSTSTTSTSSTTTTSTSSSTTTTLRSCTASAECDDGDPCNGGEVCESGFCLVQRGVGLTCMATRPIAVVTAFQGNSVALVDVRSLAVETTIPVGKAPWGVAWTPDGNRVFVTNREDDSVSVVDPIAEDVVATIGVGKQPLGVAVHPFLPRAYVTSYDDGKVSVIDTTTLGVVGTIAVDRGPAGVAVHPAGSRLYVSNYIDGTVSVIDVNAERVVATVPVPDLPLGIAVHPSGSKVYVVSLRGRMVTVIGTVSDTVLSRVRVGRKPVGVAFDPAGTRAYVSNSGDDSLTVLDAATDAVVGERPVGDFPLGVAVTDTGAVWSCDGDADQVTVIHSDTDVSSLEVPGAPVSMGLFIGALPDECPAPALVCDDANPLTGDACQPGVGCTNELVPGARGIGQAVDALVELAGDPSRDGDPLVVQVRQVLPEIASAVEAAETGGDKAAIKLARKALGPLMKLLGRARREGTLGAAGPQMLDIAREIRQQLRRL